MSANKPLANFFVTGGTMLPDAPSYVERQADRDLYESLAQGKYCYVLTARQMGKSSLMVRTAVKLRQACIGAVVVDLTSIGQNLTVDQWYVSALSWIGHEFEEVEGEVERYWLSQPLLSPAQRWTRALRDIVLPRFQGQLVIFVDEVDYVQNLPFPMDEFFAAVRECYNLRAEDERMRRLTFCLIGVATPSDLIADKRLTPFNIGERIELHDFTPAEAEPLARGLQRVNGQSLPLLHRVLFWTGGHPYLTQRLCRAIAENKTIHAPENVDHLCNALFLTPRARELDDNLTFVRDRLLRGEEDRAGLLNLYAKAWKGKRVEDDGTNPLVGTLRLSGITRAQANCLAVRNRIYERVFDDEWIRTNMPDAELRRQREAFRRGVWRAALAAGLVLFLLAVLTFWAIRERDRAEREAAGSRRIAYNASIKLAQRELENANIRRAAEILESLNPKGGEKDLRGFEWLYLWQASRRGVQTHNLTGAIAAMAFSSDGKHLAVAESLSATGNGKSRFRFSLISLDGNQVRDPVEIVAGAIMQRVAFTADLQRALVETDEQAAKLVDLRNGRTLQALGGHPSRLSSLALTPDGKRAVTADKDGGLTFWELTRETAIPIRANRRGQEISWTAFSPAGDRVVTVDDGAAVQVWSFASGRELLSVNILAASPQTAIFSPDGTQLLIADRNGVIYTFVLSSQRYSAKPTGHTKPIRVIAFSPDHKRIATGSEDKTVNIWSPDLTQNLATIKGHGGGINTLAWSADSNLLSTGSTDASVKIWNVNEEIEANKGIVDQSISSYLATALPDNEHLFAVGVIREETTRDEKLRLLKLTLKTGKRELIPLEDVGGKPLFAIFSPDTRWFAAGGESSIVNLYDLQGQKISTMKSSFRVPYLFAASFSPDGTQLVFLYDVNTMTICDVETGREIRALRSETPLQGRVVFSADGRRVLAACRNGEVVAWELPSGQQMIFKGQIGSIVALAVSRDGTRLAVGGGDRTLRLWDAQTGHELRNFGQADLIQRIAFSPDGRRIVTGGVEDGAVKIWNTETGDEALTLYQHAGPVQSLTFSKNGNALVTSGRDGRIKWFGEHR